MWLLSITTAIGGIREGDLEQTKMIITKNGNVIRPTQQQNSYVALGFYSTTTKQYAPDVQQGEQRILFGLPHLPCGLNLRGLPLYPSPPTLSLTPNYSRHHSAQLCQDSEADSSLKYMWFLPEEELNSDTVQIYGIGEM